jgi:pyruvate formate lyase activating enzyme
MFSSLTPFTAQDWPGKLAAIAWVAGCPLRCHYCHNPDLALGKGGLPRREVLDFLSRREGLLDGLVLSGGEATLLPELEGFCRSVRELGFKVKLDTAGSRPEVLKQLLEAKLLDAVALDYKAPNAEAYAGVTGRRGSFADFRRSLELVLDADLDYCEVRSTWHSALLSPGEIQAILDELERRRFRGTWALQHFRRPPSGRILGDLPEHRPAPFNPGPRPFTVLVRN